MSVVAYDYTGYGLSPNKPSEENVYKDIEGVLSFMVSFLNYPTRQDYSSGILSRLWSHS